MDRNAPRQTPLDGEWFRHEVAATVVGIGTVVALFALVRAIPHPGLQRTLNRWLNRGIGSSPTR